MTNKEKWISLFEQVVGRKPTPEEFLMGKKSNFDLKQIRQIAGLAPELSEASDSPVNSAPHQSVETVVTSAHPAGMEVGQANDQVQVSPQSVSEASNSQFAASPKVKEPLTKTQKIKRVLTGLGVVTVAGLIGGYYHLDSVTGPEVAVEQFSTAVSNNDYDRVAQLLSTKDNKWNKEEAKDFLAYLKDSEIEPVQVLERLAVDKGENVYNDDNGNKLLGLEEAGKRFGLFADYRVATYPVKVFAQTNIDGLSINGQKLEKDKEVELGDFKLATHDLSLSGKTDLGELNTQLVIDPNDVEDNQVLLNLEQKTQRISAKMPSDLPETSNKKLIVNGKDLGEGLTKDVKVFDNQELEVYATFSYEGSDYTTEKVKQVVTDEASVLEIPLVVSETISSKINSAKTEKEKREKEAEEAARQAEAQQAALESVKPEIEAALIRYRSALNAVLSGGSTSGLANAFTSNSNATYLYVVQDVLPDLRNDGLRRYDTTTDSITIHSVEGDIVKATVAFSGTAYFNDSSKNYSFNGSRDYELQRIGGQLYIQYFSK